MRHINITLLLLLVITVFCGAAPPDLQPRDVKIKLREIMRHHATQKQLDPVIVRRSMENYVEMLDPGKTYLTKPEIADALDPPSELVSTVLKGHQTDDYTFYENLYQLMTSAIDRRNLIEEEVATLQLPTNVNVKEFADLDWAENEEQLKQRILTLRALQTQTASKLDEESKESILERLTKRRKCHEARMLGANDAEQKQLALSQVLKATASALDAQTAYFTPDEASDFVNELQRRVYGVGVQLRDTLNGFTVIRVIDGGPSDVQDALKVNDRIVGVDGEVVVGLDILDAVQLIRGPAGTNVRLTVLRDDEESIDLEIERGEVVVKETRIESKVEEGETGTIGHVSLHSFYQDATNSSADDLRMAIAQMRKEHDIKGLVLDLRHNSGGLLPQAIEVTGLFIKKGVVASIKENDGYIRHLRDISGSTAWDGPLVVLVSRGSASASEIVAQALQDYGRALVVGDPTTFGKGTYQTSSMDTMGGRYVNSKGEFKVTRGIYYTVSGKTPQLTGVISDIEVPGLLSELELGERHSKWPLQPDRIKDNFNDDLSDIGIRARAAYYADYKLGLQPCLSCYTMHLDKLRQRSQERISQDSDYQAFLSVLKGEETEIADQKDFQLIETMHIMDDLIQSMQPEANNPVVREAA